MIPKSVQRFSEKILLKQEARAGRRFNEKSSRSGVLHASEGFGAQLDPSEERKVKRRREPIAAVQAGRRRAITAILALVCIVLPQLARAQGDVAPGNRALKAAVAPRSTMR